MDISLMDLEGLKAPHVFILSKLGDLITVHKYFYKVKIKDHII